MAYTTTNFIADLKKQGMIPTSQTTYDNSSILQVATRMMRSKLVPHLSATREGYFIWDHEVDLVSGKLNYPLPERSIALSLDDVYLSNESGDVRSIALIPAQDREDWLDAGFRAYNTPAFYLKWNQLCLTSDPQVGTWTKLCLPYAIRLGNLVEESEAARITAIDFDNKRVTVNALPESFVDTTLVDFIKGRGGFEYLEIDKEILTVDTLATTITFDSALPEDLEEGDWIALQGESPIPQIPEELMPILVHESLVKILTSIGDLDHAKVCAEELKDLWDAAMKIVTPRVKGETKFVNSGVNRRFRGVF